MSYRDFTDSLVKFAVEEPRALVVVVDELRVESEPLYTAFASAWMRVGDWPGVPIRLVVSTESRRELLHASAIHRFIPVCADVPEAMRGLADQPPRRRAIVNLVRAASCGQRARRFVDATCERWHVAEARGDALLIATELVENSFLHSAVDGDMQLRLELRNQLFTIAVGDDDPHEALLREPGAGGSRHYGLHLVARLARSWGCAPRWPTGKVVWAVLATGQRRSMPGDLMLGQDF
ncbi:ATP-binding protein [Nocardia heshunensis]